jgi:hypothetical protein
MFGVFLSSDSEFYVQESHVVWCEQVNEKQNLKNVFGKIHKGFDIKRQYYLDHILLKVNVEDRHINKFDSLQQQEIFLQNIQTASGMYPDSYSVGTRCSFHGIKAAWS